MVQGFDEVGRLCLTRKAAINYVVPVALAIGNSISTTKYNLFTFLPKGLFEQFRRVAKLYFLMISILSATPFSPVSPVTNMVPLSLVLLVSLCEEAYEDWTYFKANNGRAFLWKKLQVGDIVKENLLYVIYVIMSTFYFYLAIVLVPIGALLLDFIYQGVQRCFFPSDYQIFHELHCSECDDYSRGGVVEVNTPEEARTFALTQLPGETSKHTGFAFDSLGYESFFASQQGVYAPYKAWDVARRSCMKIKGHSKR